MCRGGAGPPQRSAGSPAVGLVAAVEGDLASLRHAASLQADEVGAEGGAALPETFQSFLLVSEAFPYVGDDAAGT